MYAVLRINTFDPTKMEAAGESLAEFDRLHSSQPGYVGSVVVDLGGNRRFALNLWESLDASRAAFGALVPEVDRLLGPLMGAESEYLGSGSVLSSDLAVKRPSLG